MMGRWWKIYYNDGIGKLVLRDRRWAQTGEGAILAYRAQWPRGGQHRPVVAIPEDEMVHEKA